MLVRQQPANPRGAQHRLKEARRDIAGNHTVTVFRIGRRVQYRRVHRPTDEPGEQQVVVQLLHHLALRVVGVERLQQERPQKLLQRDLRPSSARIRKHEIRRQRCQSRVHQNPDRPQRLIRRNPDVQIPGAEQAVASLVTTPHTNLRHNTPPTQEITMLRMG